MPGRIPEALKNVFLASQTGIDVNQIQAPKDGVGFKVFKNRRLRRHIHNPVVHQKLPQPPMAPRRSSLGRSRRGSSGQLSRVPSSGSLSASSTGTASVVDVSTSASIATKHHIGQSGTKPKVCVLVS